MPVEDAKKKHKLFPFNLYRKRSSKASKGKSKSLVDLYGGGEAATDDSTNGKILKKKRLSQHDRVVVNSSFESNEGVTYEAEQFDLDTTKEVLSQENSEDNCASNDEEMDASDENETEERAVDCQVNDLKKDEDSETEELMEYPEAAAKLPEFPPGMTAALAWKSKSCSLFEMEVEIREGVNLIARDRSGTSDPYVKAKFRGKCVYKSKIVRKNLNPVWNEKFNVFFDDVDTNLVFKVYDFDRLSSDDQMGVASLSVGDLEVNRLHVRSLDLINRTGLQEDLGQIVISILVTPKGTDDAYEAKGTRYCVDRKSSFAYWDSSTTSAVEDDTVKS